MATNDSRPPVSDSEHKVLGFLKEALEEGEAFLRSQKGYTRINDTIKAIMGDSPILQNSTLSQTTVNHVSKVATDLTAMCTDVKPFWEYQTKNNRFKKHTEILGALSEHWWLNRLIDLKFADVVRYSLCGGTGYAAPFYNTTIQDQDMSAEDPRDLLPIRPPSVSLGLQECFGTLHRVQRTVNYVRMRFPHKADYIQADRDGSVASQSLANTRAGALFEKYGSPFRERLFGDKPQKELPRVPSVDLYTCYLADDAVNESSSPKGVGDFQDSKPLNNWSYVVQPGEPLYPRKRCIIFTQSTILYDGPSVYWHGLFPYAKLTLDPWPWLWLGKGVLWDVLPIQKATDGILRIIDDHLEQVARPGVLADKQTVSKSVLDKVDTRKAGLKIWQNMAGGKGITIQPPPVLPQDILEILKYYEEKMYDLPGIKDLSSMMRLNQMPSSDTIERLTENMSPSVRLRSRVVEAFMRDFATMIAWNFSQFCPLQTRIAILGAQGVTPDDFDFDPDSFLPAWTSADYDDNGVVNSASMARGPLPRYNRAQQFFKQISYHIAPSSLLNSSEIETQLKYLQLSRAGLIDHWTLLEVLNIPNVGSPPEGATTITERLMAEQQMGLGMQVSAAGRKSSGQEPPAQRSSGAVSESG